MKTIKSAVKIREERLFNLINACFEKYSEEEMIEMFNQITDKDYQEKKYCAKWVREQVHGLPKAILPFKQKSEKLKAINDSLLSALVSAQKMIYELGDSYCRDKEGYIKPTAAKNGWDADTELKIGMAIRNATNTD